MKRTRENEQFTNNKTKFSAALGGDFIDLIYLG